MRIAIGAALISLFFVTSSFAGDRYVAKVHILHTDGTYSEFVLTNTEFGVSRAECDLRMEAWLEENSQLFDMAKEKLKKEGKQSGMSITCERKED